ncbi:hypothetical protein HKX48_001393, partial [Thoreauomyces humboldtii]
MSSFQQQSAGNLGQQPQKQQQGSKLHPGLSFRHATSFPPPFAQPQHHLHRLSSSPIQPQHFQHGSNLPSHRQYGDGSSAFDPASGGFHHGGISTPPTPQVVLSQHTEDGSAVRNVPLLRSQSGLPLQFDGYFPIAPSFSSQQQQQHQQQQQLPHAGSSPSTGFDYPSHTGLSHLQDPSQQQDATYDDVFSGSGLVDDANAFLGFPGDQFNTPPAANGSVPFQPTVLATYPGGWRGDAGVGGVTGDDLCSVYSESDNDSVLSVSSGSYSPYLGPTGGDMPSPGGLGQQYANIDVSSPFLAVPARQRRRSSAGSLSGMDDLSIGDGGGSDDGYLSPGSSYGGDLQYADIVQLTSPMIRAIPSPSSSPAMYQPLSYFPPMDSPHNGEDPTSYLSDGNLFGGDPSTVELPAAAIVGFMSDQVTSPDTNTNGFTNNGNDGQIQRSASFDDLMAEFQVYESSASSVVVGGADPASIGIQEPPFLDVGRPVAMGSSSSLLNSSYTFA